MALDIFAPRARTGGGGGSSDDVVGRFRSGHQINKRPISLKEWRVTTGDPDVANTIAELLGGEVGSWDAKGEDNLEVFTDTGKVDVILDGVESLDARMVVWARGAKRIVVCQDEVYDTEGGPYECELGGWRTRAEHAEQGHVCEPLIKLRFRLADAPEMGYFEYQTGAWSLVSQIGYILGDIEDSDEEGAGVTATLALEAAEFEKDGKPVKFTKPVIAVTGPNSDDVE